MTTQQQQSPPLTSQSACQDDQGHSWRRVQLEEPMPVYSFRCDRCLRTLAGIVA